MIWIIVQILLLFSLLPAIIVPIVLGQYYYLFIIPVIVIVHFAVGSLGAAVFWEMERLKALGKDKETTTISFKKNEVKNIKIGKGWARGIIWLAIPYFILLIQAEGYCVSFEAPGSTGEKNLVYALHMQSKEDAARFAGILS
ncbi:MAG: hypothetical protein ACYCXK_01970 [Candidatus Humimicrobiaceae bacterium]